MSGLLERFERRGRREARRLRLWSSGPLAVVDPVFLVGSVRSGSTLLARWLGSHPRLAYLGFELSEVWSEAGGVEIACPDTLDAHCPAWNDAELPAERAEALRHALGQRLVLDGAEPGDRLLNKNPHLSNKLPLVTGLFPDARLVVTARDLPSTVASTERLWRKVFEQHGRRHLLPAIDPEASRAGLAPCWSQTPPVDPDDVDPRRLFPGGAWEVLAEYWLATYEAVDAGFARARELSRTAGRDLPEPILVCHRDLVADPGGTLERVLDALDLPARDLAPPAPLDPTRNDRWRELLGPDGVAALGRFVDRNRERIEALTWADGGSLDDLTADEPKAPA